MWGRTCDCGRATKQVRPRHKALMKRKPWVFAQVVGHTSDCGKGAKEVCPRDKGEVKICNIWGRFYFRCHL